MNRNIYIFTVLFAVTIILLGYCGCSDKNTDPDDPKQGTITLNFLHYNEGSPILFDSLKYTNEAGNQYMVNEIQYFISDVTLKFQDGSSQLLDGWKDIHYVDSDIPSSHEWKIFDGILTGQLTGLTFTFGINEEKNQSLMFTNPPESFMFWPEYLGGGYHYLKLNGKWKAMDNSIKPFNFHLGIGQIYDNEGNITEFIQNYFTVDLPVFSIDIKPDSETVITVIMNVENWFRQPETYNHDDWGGDIMQNQNAMIIGVQNGHNVFMIGEIE